MTDYDALKTAVIKGKRNEVTAIVQAAIDANEDLNAILDRGMIPAMREIGDKFSRRHSTVLKGIASVERELRRESPLGRQIAGTLALLERR